ncbi:hypothetical protein M422DRAFT_239066 [Sphaerobolus stellatus SS14]|nr:hypothetical protein M422DRAFT_239066 [Sphaerobolus stellatus SS14]
MSFTQIWGNFILKSSRRENPYDNGVNNSSFHLHYSADLITNDTTTITVDIRIYQQPSKQPFPDGTTAFVYGQFYMEHIYQMDIEVIQIIAYPEGSTADCFPPRVTVAGHIIQDTHEFDDGTQIIFINTIGYVQDYFQVLTVIGAMAMGDSWPPPPPSPKLHSPVHITGIIDCIDRKGFIPVIAIEELSHELGNHRVAELANHARIARAKLIGRPLFPETAPIEFDPAWCYFDARLSISSIPDYTNPYPTPFPYNGPLWGEPKPVNPVYNKIEHLASPEFPYPSTQIASQRTISDDEQSNGGIITDNCGEVDPSAQSLHHDTIYHEDLLLPYEKAAYLRDKRKQCFSFSKISKSSSSKRKLRPTSKYMINRWLNPTLKPLNKDNEKTSTSGAHIE